MLQQNANLQPLVALTTEMIFDENGMSKIKYFRGYPRQYRFDASRGLVNLNGETPITTAKQPFKFAPLAYRVFEATLFSYEKMKWTEFFFLNADLQVCAVLFHQFSTESFLSYAFNHLFYSGLNACEVCWTVTPNEKVNPRTASKYYIASFEAEALTPDTKAALEAARTVLEPLFRAETLADDSQMIASMFFNDAPEIAILEAAQESEAERLDSANDKAAKNFAKGVTKRKEATEVVENQ